MEIVPVPGKALATSPITPNQLARKQAQEITFSPESIPIATSSGGEKNKFLETSFISTIIIEDIHKDNDPYEIATIYLNNHLHPSNNDKTREWYEAILLETESIILVHYLRMNTNIIAYSKFQIYKIISYKEWGMDLSKPRKLQREGFNNKYFQYSEYIEAWHNVFAFQNNNNSHKWLIQIKIPIKGEFPNWFKNWFQLWGSRTEILPPNIQTSQRKFIDYNNSDTRIDLHMYFMVLYQIPWIMKWSYQISDDYTNNWEYIPKLGRQVYIKWWDVYENKSLDPESIKIKRVPFSPLEAGISMTDYINKMRQ
ncbi:uncharacterized protein LOC110008379 [Amborella trichopoda]|uniref:uncharacterized protein LOC110008379 n=1 Tax=Amborella trichopoda TaxID=13333 RepID=UPI0009BF1DED|nr:uncharacterized protein LOC110008379 [Amborella trichopoda]|eukprot:XP_020530956.1 uncharacterized protein LOC110008379 [Amborella trichopoda]